MMQLKMSFLWLRDIQVVGNGQESGAGAHLNLFTHHTIPRLKISRSASHLVSQNANLAFVKQPLGYKSIGSAIRYATTSDQQASKATASALMKLL